jgi:hypothetical protein
VKPIKTLQTNFIYGMPAGQKGDDLPCVITSDGRTISTWELSPEERERLARGGHLELHVWMRPPPPCGLVVIPPPPKPPLSFNVETVAGAAGAGAGPPAAILRLDEAQRQALLLALATLATSDAKWDPALNQLALQIDQAYPAADGTTRARKYDDFRIFRAAAAAPKEN